MEKEKIEVAIDDFKITSNPNIVLHTEGLKDCVGLVLLDHEKRGLMNIFYDGSSEFDFTLAEESIETFLAEFKEKNPTAYLAAVPVFDHNQYAHPMVEYAQSYLARKGIELSVERVDLTREFRSPATIQKRNITTKQLVVHPEKLLVIYMFGNMIMNIKKLD